jgi:hypothetical protein
VARDPNTIQAEIERARDALAVTVDELSTRVNPKRVVEKGTESLAATFSSPKVKYTLMAIGGLIVLLTVRRIFR